MKLHVLATGTSRGQDLSRFQRDPHFRKATRNMMMGYAALEPVLQNFPKLNTASFVFGSSFGELQTTQDFLSTLANQGIARPLLFQNSLHNATLGFLALKLGVPGPSVTTSHRHFTGESCLELASILIDAGSPLCIALAVDTRVAALESGIIETYPAEVKMDEGAAALLLANEATVRELGVNSLAIIDSVDRHMQGEEHVSGSYYDSNALEHVIEAIEASNSHGDLRLNKPDGSFSIIRLSKKTEMTQVNLK